ncbi:MAG: hypothetical protein ACRDTD_09515 [Pseudonocardiaceae bacterium]
MTTPEPVSIHEVTTPPSGYTLVLPPGWSRIPLRRGTDQVITRILDRAFAAFPRDKVASLRRELHLRLQDLAGRARESSGLDLYLPTEQMHGVTATASFVVAEMSVGSAEPVEPSMLVARLVAGSEHTTAVELAGTTGTRTEHVAAADADQGVEHASRRVDYVLPVPTDPYRWVIVSFSTLGSGDPTDEFAQLLVELFDAIMTTFRWRQP